MALLRSLVLGPVHGGRCGGGVASTGGTLVAQNPPPLYHMSNRKNHSSSRLIPTFTVLHLHNGSRSRRSNFVVERSSLPPICFSNGGGCSGRDEKGVQDEDADIEELLARLQRKLVIHVQPLQETRREEAVRKGREMLFRHFCLHLGLTPQEFSAMWWARGGGGGGAEERLRLLRDFLEEEWGWRFRPLSPRAALEMLDEHMDARGADAGRPPPPTTTASAHRRRLLSNW